jgi:hypothetical protein
MRTLSFITAILFALSAKPLSAQVCNNMAILKNGASYTITSFDSKGNVTSVSKNKILSTEENGQAMEATISNETFNHKGKSMSSGDITVRCMEEAMQIDMRSMIDPYNMKGFENMQIQVEENFLAIPVKLTPGEKLKDGVLKMNISNEGQHIATIDLKVFNREVLGQEKVKTNAGSFDTWKIKYDMEMVTTTILPLKIISSGIDWFGPSAGVIKNETYNRQGKLSGYSVLTEMEGVK